MNASVSKFFNKIENRSPMHMIVDEAQHISPADFSAIAEKSQKIDNVVDDEFSEYMVCVLTNTEASMPVHFHQATKEGAYSVL